MVGQEGALHHWRSAHSPQVNLLVPAAYLVFWAFLLVFSFISEPMVCGVGVIIILTGVPIFFLGVFWRSKPKCVHRLAGELGSLPRVPGLQMGLSRGSPPEQGLPAAVLATQGLTATNRLPTTWPSVQDPPQMEQLPEIPCPTGSDPEAHLPVCLSVCPQSQ